MLYFVMVLHQYNVAPTKSMTLVDMQLHAS
jgi:hypothetical protein